MSDTTGKTSRAVLSVDHLSVEYRGRRKKDTNRVIHDVSFSLAPGETLALVGESGSGKTTIGKAILGLMPVASGTVIVNDRDVTTIPVQHRRSFAQELQVIFQDPYGSLNPSLRIGDILAEPLEIRGSLSHGEARSTIESLLEKVGLPPDAGDRYPSSFSGGQRQRIAIARAISVEPKVVICDEPTSALDVSTQAQVLELLKELQASSTMAYLFITHDLALVRSFADRVAVLQGGRLVEQGPASDVCDHPQDLYTQALMGATPVPDPIVQRQRRTARAALLAELRKQERGYEDHTSERKTA